MSKILVAGAGKSSTYLIHYLLSHASRNKWQITVADGNADAIAEKIQKHPHAKMAVIDITDASQRQKLVEEADIVVSLMPPHLHIHLAKDCLQFKKNLITSSYISPEMKEMHQAVKDAGLMFMCEMGLDPGIDHMTANQIIHSIQRVTATITSFKSYCGGLVAPENDDNPWHYKFSWNPRNIITAGLGGAKFLQNNKIVEVPYEHIFENNKKIKVNGLGSLAYYPNRDSLRYLDLYDVPDIKTFIRATLRYPDFCKGWQAIINLGLTSETDTFDTTDVTYAQWLGNKTGYKTSAQSLVEYIAEKLNIQPTDKIISMLQWLGLFDGTLLKQGQFSSADIMLDLLQSKWAMGPTEKDMVVMQHEVEYLHRNQKTTLLSTMVIKGDDREFSAMAKTVGLPMGILARMILAKTIDPPKGVLIPSMPAVYRPVLNELKHHGIVFTEEII
ncbi:saccharopine dehydrogenase family protein [Taibaiella soli]|uniref:Saccharopine dehydrogenase n=1 Tax=Taibaiella soli TaxID=1649169 RepID=A0A2W2ADX7_9BACT|nr:saccharopine dehydrogenase C-terminal domain-containing protein [Taibaiella soli]PZF71752.1 saccharopine dehydrogenase [Taibaiella soli]